MVVSVLGKSCCKKPALVVDVLERSTPIVKNPHAELQFIPPEDRIIKLLDVLCVGIFIVQQQFREHTSRLDSALDQFNHHGANVGLVVIEVDESIELIFSANVIVFDVKEAQMAGSIVAVHIPKAIVVECLSGFPVQNIFPAFVKQLDRDIILIKVLII